MQLRQLTGQRGKINEAEELAAVLENGLRQVAVGTHRQAGTGPEKSRITPVGQRQTETLATLGEQRPVGKALVQLNSNALGVTVDVGADLQHRSLAIAARQGSEIRLWHHHRNLYRVPGEILEAKGEAHLLGKG